MPFTTGKEECDVKRVGHSSAGLASSSLSADAHIFSVLAPLLPHQPDKNTPTSSHLDADRKMWLPRNDANLLVSSFHFLSEDLKRARLSDYVPLIHSPSREFSSSLPKYIDAAPNTFSERKQKQSRGDDCIVALWCPSEVWCKLLLVTVGEQLEVITFNPLRVFFSCSPFGRGMTSCRLFHWKPQCQTTL